ncbi:hypothetical protein F5X97DRAFT_322382 [Nemania serpens]|nr:hypothetical protein F5X97DRAFT_322382 [Nemania serpens]
MFEIRQTLTKGLGAFATQDIPAGTVILREKPVMQLATFPWTEVYSTVPCMVLMRAFDALDERQRAQVLELCSYIQPQCKSGVERMVQHCMDRRPEHPASYADYVRLVFIMSTNEYTLTLPDESRVSALYLQLSRFNHSCIANTVIHDVPSADERQMGVVQARYDIEAGEEITVRYIRPWTSDRASALLKTWGFNCDCPLCNTSRDSPMDHVDRLRHERVFKEIRDNDEILFRHDYPTDEQRLTRHQRRLGALEYLGPSNELLNEYAVGYKLYEKAGDEVKVDETLLSLYEVMLLICEEDDPVRVAAKDRLSQKS